jgi:DNA-binding transcriptional LysR family regulator
MRTLPPLNALRVFDAAARRLNFSAAAVELCVTHSAVSHQIRQLEDWLGQPLFVRLRDGVRLTVAGSALQQAAALALGQLEEACARLRHDPPSSEIVLGAPGSFLANWLIPRLERFEREAPHIRLRLQTSAEVAELSAKRVDALIVSGRDWPRTLSTTALVDDALGPVCARDWPQRPRQAAELAAMPLLHTRSQPHAWQEWAQSQGLDGAAFCAGRQFDHLPLMLEAAAAGLGVAIAPALLVERDIAAGRLVAPFGFARCGAAFTFCTLATRHDEPALTTLLGWLQREAQQHSD